MQISRRIRAIGIILLLLTAGALLAGYHLFGDLPVPSNSALRPARPSTFITDRNGQLLYEVIGDASKHSPLAFDQIPPACWQATVAVEDSRFFSHPGVDPVAIARAAWLNWRNGTVVSGASTLTQQLARNTLMSQEERFQQSLARKLREAWLAVQIELRYTKNEILALYLNQVYFGNFATGLEAAAQAYFGQPAQALDLAQCSLLAGLLQNQTAYNPLQHPEAARWRQSTVLSLMVQNGYIQRADAELALAEQLQFAASPFTVEAPHFVSYVEAQLTRLLGSEVVAQGGLHVQTTLDLDWQHSGERTVRWQLQRLASDPDAPRDRRISNAALVAIEPGSGAIRTMIGSPDFFDASIDGAMNGALALRQPGSTLKPLTYAVAMDPARAAAAGHAPLTAATVIADVRTAFLTAEGQPYVPQNYDLRWHGPVSVRSALANSYNLPAVKTLEQIGIPALIAQAQRQGITTFQLPSETIPHPYGLALTLGGGEVSLLELTGAYAAFANGGFRIEPYAVERVEDRSGRLLFQATDQGGRLDGTTTRTANRAQQVLDPRIAWLVSDILSDDDARSASFGRHSVLELSRPAAVKTGTTTDWRDNWTVGYTPDLVAGVWVGNADNSPMLGISGVTGAGPIWRDFMEMAHQGRPARRFPVPPGINEAEVCINSGLLPTDLCSRRRRELFLAGTEPDGFDTVYRALPVDGCNGGSVDAATPAECRGSQVYRVYPPELQEWAHANGIAAPPAAADQIATTGGAEPVTVANAAAPALRLTSPDPNSSFRLAEGLPAEMQQVRIAVQSGSRVGRVTFYVDGQAVGTADRAPYQAWWTLKPGSHRITAAGVTNDGAEVMSGEIWIEVEA